jgi:hypothetical protein
MSEYFDALMNLSGFAGGGRSPATDVSHTGADVVEIEESREAIATPTSPSSPSRPSTLAPNVASNTATEIGTNHLRASLPAAPVLRAAAGGMASIDATPTTAGTTWIAAEPRDTIVRAALEWVGADSQGVPDRQDIAEQQDVVPEPARAGSKMPTIPRRSSALQSGPEEHRLPRIDEVEVVGSRAPFRAEVSRHVLIDDVTLMTPGASLHANAVPFGHTAINGTPGPARAVPVAISDEIVEISIGAIHVRVDGPVPQLAAAEASSARMLSERAAANSALSRRALRRI